MCVLVLLLFEVGSQSPNTNKFGLSAALSRSLSLSLALSCFVAAHTLCDICAFHSIFVSVVFVASARAKAKKLSEGNKNKKLKQNTRA